MSSSEESEDDNWGLPAPSSGPKMERCLLGKIELLLPEAMLEQVNLYILKTFLQLQLSFIVEMHLISTFKGYTW